MRKKDCSSCLSEKCCLALVRVGLLRRLGTVCGKCQAQEPTTNKGPLNEGDDNSLVRRMRRREGLEVPTEDGAGPEQIWGSRQRPGNQSGTRKEGHTAPWWLHT